MCMGGHESSMLVFIPVPLPAILLTTISSNLPVHWLFLLLHDVTSTLVFFIQGHSADCVVTCGWVWKDLTFQLMAVWSFLTPTHRATTFRHSALGVPHQGLSYSSEISYLQHTASLQTMHTDRRLCSKINK